MALVQHFDLIFMFLGAVFLLAGILPAYLEKLPLSLPIIYVAIGLLLPFIWPDLPQIDPIAHGAGTERLAELAVIISLMSAGLKLDRPLSWGRWQSTWRLLGITMPLCILALAFGGSAMLGLSLPAAVLLGASLAPTDPVLASGVQVGPPGKGDGNETRFALTSEAGLNDGLAFPFVNLAIVLASVGLAIEGSLLNWLIVDVLWKISSGVLTGMLTGHLLAVLVFRFYHANKMLDAFIVIALTLFAYGATEFVHGYGFIGVFVAALKFRHYQRDHRYHIALHDFSEQIERLLMVVILILFGAAISQGLLAPLDTQGILLGIGFLLLVRPIAGIVALTGRQEPLSQRWVTAIFGIRGIGTFYYLAYGLNHGSFSHSESRMLWAVAGIIILASTVLHGLSVNTVMNRLR